MKLIISVLGKYCNDNTNIGSFHRNKWLLIFQSGAGSWYDKEINKIFINHDDTDNITQDIIYLLNVLSEQAKQCYTLRKQTLTKDKKTVRLKSFDLSLATLLDDVRADLKKVNFDFTNDQILVYYILKWLYRGKIINTKKIDNLLFGSSIIR